MFGKRGLLIIALWIPLKYLQFVSKTSKVSEAREHNASSFQISFTPIFAVLRKMEIMAKFLSYPLTPILCVLYSCLFSQVREQKLVLCIHLLVPAVQTKGCTLSQAISSHPFLLWEERRKDEPGLHTSTLFPPSYRHCSSLADWGS